MNTTNDFRVLQNEIFRIGVIRYWVGEKYAGRGLAEVKL